MILILQRSLFLYFILTSQIQWVGINFIIFPAERNRFAIDFQGELIKKQKKSNKKPGKELIRLKETLATYYFKLTFNYITIHSIALQIRLRINIRRFLEFVCYSKPVHLLVSLRCYYVLILDLERL